MKWLEMSTENCTVQRTLDVVGEKWTLLILRDAFNGVRRFDDFRRHMGLSEAVLAAGSASWSRPGSCRPSRIRSRAAGPGTNIA